MPTNEDKKFFDSNIAVRIYLALRRGYADLKKQDADDMQSSVQPTLAASIARHLKRSMEQLKANEANISLFYFELRLLIDHYADGSLAHWALTEPDSPLLLTYRALPKPSQQNDTTFYASFFQKRAVAGNAMPDPFLTALTTCQEKLLRFASKISHKPIATTGRHQYQFTIEYCSALTKGFITTMLPESALQRAMKEAHHLADQYESAQNDAEREAACQAIIRSI